MLHVIPTVNPNSHLVIIKVPTRDKIVIKRVRDVNGRASLRIGIEVFSKLMLPVLNIKIIDFNNQGIPKQNRMSKMFEPIELLIAMLANPDLFTTITLEINSGTDVPAAKIVRPATVSGRPKV